MNRRKFLGMFAALGSALFVVGKLRPDDVPERPDLIGMPYIGHPRGILVIKSEVSPEQLNRFRKQWRAYMDRFGTGEWRTPILAGVDVEWIKLS